MKSEQRSATWLAVLVISGVAILTGTNLKAQQIHNGEDLLKAMHDRYAANWYDTVTFTQKSTTFQPDGTDSSETWYEAALLPGKLRIDIGPPADGNGVIIADGTLTALKKGEVSSTRPLAHLLLILGFDVYRQPAQTTINKSRAKASIWPRFTRKSGTDKSCT